MPAVCKPAPKQLATLRAVSASSPYLSLNAVNTAWEQEKPSLKRVVAYAAALLIFNFSYASFPSFWASLAFCRLARKNSKTTGNTEIIMMA